MSEAFMEEIQFQDLRVASRRNPRKMTYPPEGAAAFSKWLQKAGACPAARDWAKDMDLPTAWESCPRGSWLVWLLHRCGYQWTEEERTSVSAEYDRAKASLDAESTEYDRVVASAIRKHIPYPFAGRK